MTSLSVGGNLLSLCEYVRPLAGPPSTVPGGHRRAGREPRPPMALLCARPPRGLRLRRAICSSAALSAPPPRDLRLRRAICSSAALSARPPRYLLLRRAISSSAALSAPTPPPS